MGLRLPLSCGDRLTVPPCQVCGRKKYRIACEMTTILCYFIGETANFCLKTAIRGPCYCLSTVQPGTVRRSRSGRGSKTRPSGSHAGGASGFLRPAGEGVRESEVYASPFVGVAVPPDTSGPVSLGLPVSTDQRFRLTQQGVLFDKAFLFTHQFGGSSDRVWPPPEDYSPARLSL